MKRISMKGLIMIFMMVIGMGVNTSRAQGAVSLQLFYSELQPYGTWIQHPGYGNVWLPRVENDFVPYGTNGYWAYTEYGNTWVSDYPWGWAPFHYGRWFYDDFYGWMWIPDTVWAPAWVVWRSGGGYYGWAPLMPGISINISFNYYNRIPHYYWNFVPYRYITYRHVHRHCVPRTQVVNVIHHTTIVNHNYTDNRRQTYFTGPSRSDIERSSQSRVEVYKINNRTRPGASHIERGELNLYRPEMDNSRSSRMNSKPDRFAIDNRNENNLNSKEEFNTRSKDAGTSGSVRKYSPDREQWIDKEKMNNDSRNFTRSESFRKPEKQDLNYSSGSFNGKQLNRQPDRTQSYKQSQNENSWGSNNQQRESRTSQYSQERNQQIIRQQPQIERKNSSQFNQDNNFQKRSTPNYKSSSMSGSQRGVQVQKNSPVRTPQPVKSSSGRGKSGQR